MDYNHRRLHNRMIGLTLVQVGKEIGAGRDHMEAVQKKTKSLLANPSGGKQKLADGSTGEYFFPYSWIW